MLPEEQAANSRYFYELASAMFGYDESLLEKVQAFHFKGGQGAKTGTGGHLPGAKNTDKIAAVRGIPAGQPAISPPTFADLDSPADFRRFADRVRELTGGIPVGFKLSANHIEKDYNLRLIEETATDYIVECLPKTDAAVVWGKIIYKINKTPQVPVRVDYYDEEMVRVREIHFDDVQQIDDRIVPMRLTVLPLEKPDEQTILQYRELVFDLPIDETYFSLRNLKKP